MIWRHASAYDDSEADIGAKAVGQDDIDHADLLNRANGDRVVFYDGSGNWFVLVRLGEDRVLLFGWDRDSDLFGTAYDPWADAPDWAKDADRSVPDSRILNETASFVRWWDRGRWSRTPVDRAAIADLAEWPKADDGLYMGLREIANPWFPGVEPGRDRVAASAAAQGFEPDEPGMRYQRIATRSRTALEPVLTFVEFDDEGDECHKVEYFPSGGIGYAAFDYELAGVPTELFEDHSKAISQIADRTEHSVDDITPEAFRTEWLLATREHEYPSTDADSETLLPEFD